MLTARKLLGAILGAVCVIKHRHCYSTGLFYSHAYYVTYWLNFSGIFNWLLLSVPGCARVKIILGIAIGITCFFNFTYREKVGLRCEVQSINPSVEQCTYVALIVGSMKHKTLVCRFESLLHHNFSFYVYNKDRSLHKNFLNPCVFDVGQSMVILNNQLNNPMISTDYHLNIHSLFEPYLYD